jgi:hypothetical protein
VEADVDEARGGLRRGHWESLAEEGSNKTLKQSSKDLNMARCLHRKR